MDVLQELGKATALVSVDGARLVDDSNVNKRINLFSDK